MDFYTINIPVIKTARTNKEIKAYEVAVIIDDNAPKVMSIEEALAYAESKELDLVEVNATAVPPICKLIDYGKFLFKRKKQDQTAKKKQKQQELKTIRFGFRTSEHDLSIKADQARKFLEKGNLVKIHVMGKGRELAYIGIAREKVENFVASLADIGTVDQPVKVQENSIHSLLRPLKK